jgi:predicted transcriptional regulator
MVRQSARFDLRLDQELKDALEHVAQVKDRSSAWVVRDALRRYLTQEHALRKAPARRPGQFG